MTDAGTHPDRQDAILDAAFHAFATYGFRRTTMDDIARGVGISRTALYLHYRSKEDIFRHLAQRYFEEAHGAMDAALSRPGPVDEVLIAAFVAKDGKFMEAVLDTPHGAELMDAGFSISGAIAAEAEAEMHARFARFIDSRSPPADLGTGTEIASTIMATLKGLKGQSRSLVEYRDGQSRLARMIARAIRT